MATIARVRVEWVGAAVDGGGVSTFYSSNADPSVFNTAVRAFFNNIKGIFPNDLTFVFQGVGETIESTTGKLNGSWTMTAPASVTGADTGSWAKGVGTRVTWNTAGITRGRRVRGTTFLVPIASVCWDDNGSLSDTVMSTLNTAVPALAAADSGSMRVYSKPSAGGGTDGVAHAVTSGVAMDTVSWLRTRRT